MVMRRMKTLIPALGMLLLLGTSVHADLIGTHVRIQYFVPDLSTYYDDITVTVINPGIEVNFYPDPNNLFSIDLGSSYILMDYQPFVGQDYYSPFTFSGPRFSEISDTLTGFTLTTNMSGLTSSNVSFDDHAIWVNWQSLPFGVDTYVRLDLNTAPVPEPATMLLLASGLAGLAGFRRFRKG